MWGYSHGVEGGFGFGLSIVKDLLALRFGSSLQIASSSEGTCATFTIPVRVPDNEVPMRRSQRERTRGEALALIVGQGLDVSIRVKQLSISGFSVACVATFAEGSRILEKAPSLVVFCGHTAALPDADQLQKVKHCGVAVLDRTKRIACCGFTARSLGWRRPRWSECHRRLSILIVDDSSMLRSSVTAVLRSVGHDVAVGSDGAEGLRLYHEIGNIHAIVSDLNMPEMRGWVSYKFIKIKN